MIKMKIDIYSKLFNDKILNNMIWKCFYNFSGCVVTNVTWATHKNYTFILFSYFDNPGPAVIYIYIYTYNIIYIYIQSKGQGEPHSEVGSLCSAMCLVRFEPGTFRFWLQCLNLLGTVCIRVSYPSPLKNTTPFFFAKPPALNLQTVQALPPFKAILPSILVFRESRFRNPLSQIL